MRRMFAFLRSLFKGKAAPAPTTYTVDTIETDGTATRTVKTVDPSTQRPIPARPKVAHASQPRPLRAAPATAKGHSTGRKSAGNGHTDNTAYNPVYPVYPHLYDDSSSRSSSSSSGSCSSSSYDSGSYSSGGGDSGGSCGGGGGSE